MSKILPATSDASGVVKIEGKEVTANHLGLGKKASTGAALMEDGEVIYAPSTQSDLHDSIVSLGDLVQKLQDVLTQTVVALSALDAVTTTPGSASAAITLVTTKNLLVTTANTTFKATKDTLK